MCGVHGPALSGWLLVALCAASGAYCLLRMRTGGSAEERRAAGAEAVMGFGMALMALPAAVLTPPEWSWVVYAVVFGCAALLGLRTAVLRRGHHLHHLVGSLAMVYMAVAMAAGPEGPGGHGAHGEHGAGHGGAVVATGGIPVLTGVLLAYFGVYVLRSGARLVPVTGSPGAGGAARGTGAGAELTLVCRLSMGLAMLAMLLAL